MHSRLKLQLRAQLDGLREQNRALYHKLVTSRLQDPAQLSALQRTFREQGFVVVPDVFSADECDRLVAEAMRLADAQLSDTQADRGPVPAAGYLVDCDPSGRLPPQPRKLDAPFRKSAAFRRVALDARLRALVTALMDARATTGSEAGEPAPPRDSDADWPTDALLFTDQAFLKPPRVGSEKPWHQDNFYFGVAPVDDVITCWLALDDATPRNGCLHYVSGSHRDGLLPHGPVPGDPNPSNLVPPPGRVDCARKVAAPVPRGGVVLHHGQALHCSPRNGSGGWRRAYATHWVSSRATTDKAATFEAPLFDTAEWAAVRGYYYVDREDPSKIRIL
eukprot:g5533.t1